MRTLTLSACAAAEIREACEAAHPREACGLLLGRAGDPAVASHAIAIRNVEASSTGFTLEPAGLIGADARARDLGLDVVGVFHSHPEHPATPSRRDEENAQPGWSHLIASVRVGDAGPRVTELTSWRLARETGTGARLMPERVQVAP